jgi:hypothetical protein
MSTAKKSQAIQVHSYVPSEFTECVYQKHMNVLFANGYTINSLDNSEGVHIATTLSKMEGVYFLFFRLVHYDKKSGNKMRDFSRNEKITDIHTWVLSAGLFETMSNEDLLKEVDRVYEKHYAKPEVQEKTTTQAFRPASERFNLCVEMQQLWERNKPSILSVFLDKKDV